MSPYLNDFVIPTLPPPAQALLLPPADAPRPRRGRRAYAPRPFSWRRVKHHPQQRLLPFKKMRLRTWCPVCEQEVPRKSGSMCDRCRLDYKAAQKLKPSETDHSPPTDRQERIERMIALAELRDEAHLELDIFQFDHELHHLELEGCAL